MKAPRRDGGVPGHDGVLRRVSIAIDWNQRVIYDEVSNSVITRGSVAAGLPGTGIGMEGILSDTTREMEAEGGRTGKKRERELKSGSERVDTTHELGWCDGQGRIE